VRGRYARTRRPAGVRGHITQEENALGTWETYPIQGTAAEVLLAALGPLARELLDFESKLDRSASNINSLIAEGEARARAFLEEPRATLSASPRAERRAVPRGA
jgi:hypothetical protein